MIYNKLIYLSHVFWVAGKPICILLKRIDILSQKISKKGEAKRVQVTEWPKDVISLWGQEEKLSSSTELS